MGWLKWSQALWEFMRGWLKCLRWTFGQPLNSLNSKGAIWSKEKIRSRDKQFSRVESDSDTKEMASEEARLPKGRPGYAALEAGKNQVHEENEKLASKTLSSFVCAV